MISEQERADLDDLPGPLVAADAAGRIAYLNPAARRLFGRSGEGEPLATLMPERMRRRHEEGFRRWRATRESRLLGRSVRVPALRGDGSEFEAELTLRMFRRPDGSELVVASLRDTTAEPAPARDVIELESRLERRMYELI